MGSCPSFLVRSKGPISLALCGLRYRPSVGAGEHTALICSEHT